MQSLALDVVVYDEEGAEIDLQQDYGDADVPVTLPPIRDEDDENDESFDESEGFESDDDEDISEVYEESAAVVDDFADDTYGMSFVSEDE